jgi:type VI secretion system secreted protein VgrG
MLEELTDLNLDIHTTIWVIVIGLILLGVLIIYQGSRLLEYGLDVSYVQKKRKIVKQGSRTIFFAVIVFFAATFCGIFGENLVYQVYIPSSTITLTPSITPSLTVTLTPTITLSPTLTRTPSITPTPVVPAEVAAEFSSTLEPGDNIIFSMIKFSDEIDDLYQPIVERTVFSPPVEKVFGSFTYNNMEPGLQWSAVWVNPNGEVICYETEAWGNYTGGYGFTECEYDPETWVEGEYQVQMFLGYVWWQTNTFWFGEDPQPTPINEP